MPVWLLVADESAFVASGGRSPLSRVAEILRRQGQEAVVVVAREGLAQRVEGALSHVKIEVGVIDAQGPILKDALAGLGSSPVVLIDASTVYDPRLLSRALQWSQPTVMVDGAPAAGAISPIKVEAGGEMFVGLASLSGVDLAKAVEWGDIWGAIRTVLRSPQSYRVEDIGSLPTYSRELRRDLRPYWMPVRSAAARIRARWMLANAASKGHMEWLVLLLNRPVETWLSYHLAETRITPNQITLATNVAAYIVTALFATGYLGLGVLAALATGILDGLDGRQARIQIKTSKIGELEHVFDKLYELSWAVALGWFFSGGLVDKAFVWGTAAWMVFHILDNTAYSVFRSKRGILLDEASELDASIRLVAGRRNIYVAYLGMGVALGRIDTAFWFVVAWSGLSAIVHWVRVAQLLRKPPTEPVGG